MKKYLYYPFIQSTKTQSFGENATSFYKDNGYNGHTSEDWAVPHGTPVPACAEGRVVSIRDRDNPDLSKYRAVYIFHEEGDEVDEISIGHLDKIYVNVGDYVYPETIIGTAGNTGIVFSGGVQVTTEEKMAGSKKGTHAHGPQVRPMKKVTKFTNGMSYFYNGTTILKENGYYYEYNGNDGWLGCINPVFRYTEVLAIKAPQYRSILELFAKIMKQWLG